MSGGTSGGRTSATFYISSNTGGVVGRSPGRHSVNGGVGGGGGSWGVGRCDRYDRQCHCDSASKR